MDPTLLACALTVLVLLALLLLAVLVVGGGNLSRLGLAGRCFGRTLRDPAFAVQAQALLTLPPARPQAPPKPSGAPLRLLSLLQREGRLVDFLLESIDAYADPQVGAAVRDIHRQCHAALKEHLTLDPIFTQPEGSIVEVPAGFDPAAVRLLGNVTGHPPFRGTLQHHGWRIREMKLAVPEGQDEFILQPAEVELP